MNREAFLELADRIELEGRFDLGYYAHRPDSPAGSPRTGDLIIDCGTVGCVAGWACALAGVSHYNNYEGDIWTDASRWLDISPEVAHRLFYADADSVWAETALTLGLELTEQGDVRGWSSISAVQAAKVLRMIADGEVSL